MFSKRNSAPTNLQCDALHKEDISWKDMQKQMRSSKVVTNMAALEIVKKQMSDSVEPLFKDSDSSQINKEVLTPSNAAFYEKDEINLKYPNKSKSLTWQERKSFVMKMSSNIGEDLFHVKHEKKPRSGSLSGDEFYEMLHAAVSADGSGNFSESLSSSSKNSSKRGSFFMNSLSNLEGELMQPKQRSKSCLSSSSDKDLFDMIHASVSRNSFGGAWTSVSGLDSSLSSVAEAPASGASIRRSKRSQKQRIRTARTA